MGKFTIHYNYDFETKQYIAEIPELNLSDFGKTMDEALSNLKEALELYLEEINESKINKFNKKELEYA